MRLQFGEEESADNARYDAALLRKVARLAARLQSHEQETLTAEEMEEIGAEAGLDPAFIRKALGQYTQPKRAVDRRNYGAYAAAWWAAGWTVPIILAGAVKHATGGLLFFLFLAIYLAGGILLSHAAKGAKPASPTDISRTALLEALTALHQELASQRQHHAFLSVDGAVSTETRPNAPEAGGQQASEKLQEWITSVVKECGGQQTVKGTVALCLFPTDTGAIRAARRLQEELPQFNQDHDLLATPFQIRCGVSAGEVVIDEDAPPGQWHSPVVDHASALQNHAAPGEILVGGEVSAAALSQLEGSALLPHPIAGEPAFSWRAARPAPPATGERELGR